MNNDYSLINLKTILRILFVRIFGNVPFVSIMNIVLPIILSLMFEIPNDKRNTNFPIYIAIIFCVIIVLNILFFIADTMRNKKGKWENLSACVVNSIETIHIDTANNIYRMHKHTKEGISKNTYIDESHFNKLADFQQVSFLVCKAIYDIIFTQLGCGDCEVTVYQKFAKDNGKKYDYVKMIAYATNDSVMPATYDRSYPIKKMQMKPCLCNYLNKKLQIL